MLYETVTGVPPYSRGDHMSVMYQHVQGKARIAQEINPALPPGLSDLVMKSMAVDKTKRYQSMDRVPDGAGEVPVERGRENGTGALADSGGALPMLPRCRCHPADAAQPVPPTKCRPAIRRSGAAPPMPPSR